MFPHERAMIRFSPVRLLKLVFSAALAVLSAAGVSAQPESRANHSFERSQPIPGRYIVVFKNEVADARGESDRKVRKAGGRKHHTFSRTLKGFSATLSDSAAEELRNDPSVDFVEQDQTVSIRQVQNPATWGLDRIDQADRPLDSAYHFNYTGAGVYAFIIDTGIRADHAQFTGRMLAGYSTVPDANGTNDCDGHGTHVAGTVGGSTWGVARGVTLIPVRVLDCEGSGTWSGVIAGIDWVADSPLRPAVANMSLGGPYSASVNAAVAAAVMQGVTMVVAAGNENNDACKVSPASEPSAITVGSTTSGDIRSSFSNFGKCVDIFAPGSSITSSWNASSTATNTISGTSMASPHVAGVSALALQANPSASPAAIAAFVTAQATTNRLGSLGSGSPNRLLYSLGAGVPTEPPLPVIAVKSLSGKANRISGGDWRAQVTVTIRNVGTSASVPGATVRGTFSPGGAGLCVTTNKGNCVMTSSTISAISPMTVFTITSVAGANMSYDSGQNAVSQITINKR